MCSERRRVACCELLARLEAGTGCWSASVMQNRTSASSDSCSRTLADQQPVPPERKTIVAQLLLLSLTLLFGVLLPAVVEAASEVVPVDGDPFSAELVQVDAHWQLKFQAAEGARSMPAADLVRWGTLPEVRRGPIVVLGNGGVLVVEGFQADKEAVTAESLLFGRVRIPLERVAGVAFQVPADHEGCDELLDLLLTSQEKSDQVILANGDRIAGRYQSYRDATVHLESDAGPIDIERHRVRAILFNPTLVHRGSTTGLHALLGFSDGSRLDVRTLELSGPVLQVTPVEGLTWNAAREDLVSLQPLGGRVTYLSDLKAADYRHVPFLKLTWPYRVDRSVTGGWLRAGERLYSKGLGLHSAARLTYLLPDGQRRFDAQVAIDDNAGTRGSIRFRLFVDGTLKYTSPTVRGGMAPIPISVELKGAKRLDLVVDFADRADVLDRADLLEARLVR